MKKWVSRIDSEISVNISLSNGKLIHDLYLLFCSVGNYNQLVKISIYASCKLWMKRMPNSKCPYLKFKGQDPGWLNAECWIWGQWCTAVGLWWALKNTALTATIDCAKRWHCSFILELEKKKRLWWTGFIGVFLLKRMWSSLRTDSSGASFSPTLTRWLFQRLRPGLGALCL